MHVDTGPKHTISSSKCEIFTFETWTVNKNVSSAYASVTQKSKLSTMKQNMEICPLRLHVHSVYSSEDSYGNILVSQDKLHSHFSIVL